MRPIALPLVAIVCAIASANVSALELASYPKVFTADEGVEVVIAPTADGKQALMRISGVNHPVDKVVFLTRVERWGGSTDAYVTTFDGRDSGMVQKKGSVYGGGDRYVAYLPGRKQEYTLSFDEKKTKAMKPATLLASYESQTKQGVQQKLARFDREKHVTQGQAALAATDAAASASCGVPVKTTVDWAAINDDRLKKVSVQGYCGAVAAGLDRMCSDASANFKQKAGALSQITCQFGPELRARVVDRKVVFTTEENAPNQDDFIREFLRNN
jgi:Tfp pilus assembly protein PilX